jgi:hypothetical protein
MDNENIDTRKDKFFIEKFGQDWFTASPESRKFIRNTLETNPSALGDDAVRYAQSQVGTPTMIGKAIEAGFLNSVGNVARGMRIFKDMPNFGNSLLDTAQKAEAIQYQPYAPKDDSFGEQSSSMAKNLLLGSVKMLSDPVATGAMIATDGLVSPLTRGLLSSAEAVTEATPAVVRAAQRLNNPITESMNPYARSLIENTTRGAVGNLAYDATQNAVEGTNHDLGDSALMGGAFGLIGSGAGMAWKSTLGDEAKWANKYSSNAQLTAQSARGQANTDLANAIEEADRNKALQQAQEEQQLQQQQMDMQNAMQAEAEQKAQYDAMPFEDKLKAQSEPSIETSPLQDADSNIIKDMQNEPSQTDNIKDNTGVEGVADNIQIANQQAINDTINARINAQDDAIAKNAIENEQRQVGGLNEKVNPSLEEPTIDKHLGDTNVEKQADSLMQKTEDKGSLASENISEVANDAKQSEKATNSENMQRLNELSQTPYFDKHLNEIEKQQAKEAENNKNNASRVQQDNNNDVVSGSSDSINGNTQRFETTNSDVSAIRQAQKNGKIDSTVLDRLSNDLELRAKEQASEYLDKAKSVLRESDSKGSTGNTILDARKELAIDKIKNAKVATTEGQRQIDEAIKELKDVKAERDKMIVDDFASKVGSEKEVKEFTDGLNLAEKIMNCKG